MNKKIRVLDIVSTDIGAYRLLRSRVKKLNEFNDIYNAILCPPGKWVDHIKKEGIKVFVINMSRGINPFSIFKEYKAIRKAIKSFKPDIVHTHNSKTGAIGRFAAKKENVPVVIHQVHGFHFTYLKGIKRNVFEVIEKYLSKKSDIILFQNQEELEIARSLDFDRNAKLVFIGNGVPPEEFKHFRKRDNLNRKKQIICIARIEPVKNHEYLINSIAHLIRVHPDFDFELKLIGEYNEERISKLKELAAHKGVENKIRYFGAVEREIVLKELFKADLSVLTSLKEGKPRALMESCFAGVPIVATDVIGTREVVKDGVNGYLVPLDKPEQFAEKIYEILTSEEKWKKMSENCIEIASREFDENKIIEKLRKIYKMEVAKWREKSQ